MGEIERGEVVKGGGEKREKGEKGREERNRWRGEGDHKLVMTLKCEQPPPVHHLL